MIEYLGGDLTQEVEVEEFGSLGSLNTQKMAIQIKRDMNTIQ